MESEAHKVLRKIHDMKLNLGDLVKRQYPIGRVVRFRRNGRTGEQAYTGRVIGHCYTGDRIRVENEKTGTRYWQPLERFDP